MICNVFLLCRQHSHNAAGVYDAPAWRGLLRLLCNNFLLTTYARASKPCRHCSQDAAVVHAGPASGHHILHCVMFTPLLCFCVSAGGAVKTLLEFMIRLHGGVACAISAANSTSTSVCFLKHCAGGAVKTLLDFMLGLPVGRAGRLLQVTCRVEMHPLRLQTCIRFVRILAPVLQAVQ